MRVLAGLGLVVLLASCSAPAKKPEREPSMVVDTRTVPERLSAAIDRRLELGLGFGFVGAARDSGKTQIFVRGLKSVEPPAKISDTSVVEIGSISKTFTGILIEKAVEEGKLKLSTTLGEILPVVHGSPAGAITIEALGLHCSGLPRLIPKVLQPDPKDPYREGTEKMLIDGLLAATNVMPAGCTYATRSYSNFGYTVLGLVLEKIYHHAYRDILRTKLVQPLRLGETGIDRGKKIHRKFRSKVIFGYTPAGDLTEPWTFPGAYGAAGGIEMTAKEMGRFLEALLDPGSSASLGMTILNSFKTGIGWDSAPGAELVWKNGGTGGFSSILSLVPSKKKGAMVVTNITISPDDVGHFAVGYFPYDPLVKTIESGRVHGSEAELGRLKGQFAYSRLLDEGRSEVDPSKLPPNEIGPFFTPVDILEKSGRIVSRLHFGADTVGLFLYPEAEEGHWHCVDGIYNTDQLQIEGDGPDLRLYTPIVGASKKKYLFEYKKLETKPEVYPAFERN